MILNEILIYTLIIVLLFSLYLVIKNRAQEKRIEALKKEMGELYRSWGKSKLLHSPTASPTPTASPSESISPSDWDEDEWKLSASRQNIHLKKANYIHTGKPLLYMQFQYMSEATLKTQQFSDIYTNRQNMLQLNIIIGFSKKHSTNTFGGSNKSPLFKNTKTIWIW